MKKQFFQFTSLALLLFGLTFAWSCKKDESEPAKTAPTGVTTSAAASITPTGATIPGTVATNGGETLLSRGAVYSKTNTTPNLEDDVIELASGTDIGAFSVALTGLDGSTKYYVRAFATNSVGISYGSVVEFTTSTAATVPSVTTTAANAITTTTAKSGGDVVNDGGAAVTEKGIYWGEMANPGPSNGGNKVDGGSGTGSFISSITGLTEATTYHVRAYAKNSAGTSYGANVAFSTTSIQPPSLSTKGASNVSSNSAISGGNISNLGNGTLSQAGVCWNTTGNPTIANAKTTDGNFGTFTSTIAGLNFNTRYYVRAYATNQAGTSYGNQIEFTTKSNLTIGQNFGGGKLAYEFVPGDPGFVYGENHGLVAQATDKPSSVWAVVSDIPFSLCLGFTPNFPLGNTGLGEGYNATQALLLYDDATPCFTSAPAARSCWADDVTGSQTDWYLPNEIEFKKICGNNSAGLGLSLNSDYWTSTNLTPLGSQVRNVYTGDCNGYPNPYSQTKNVRAIRKF